MVDFLNLLFNGVAYGMLLFLMAAGLSVTMGLMGFANLAHAAFAMFGGYVAVTLMNRAGWPFLATLPAAAIATAVLAVILERLLFRRLYRAPEVDQILCTVGILFMATAATTFIWTSSQQPVNVPGYLSGAIQAGAFSLSVYRIFLVVVGGLLTLGLILLIDKTPYGARIRAAVDNQRMTTSIGIDVDLLFMGAFAIGTALAGLGGALSINLLGLDPNFGVDYLTYVLIVVVLGGLGSIRGSLAAALLLGVCDTFGKYYLPSTGAFIVYTLTVVLLLWRPQGLFARR